MKKTLAIICIISALCLICTSCQSGNNPSKGLFNQSNPTSIPVSTENFTSKSQISLDKDGLSLMKSYFSNEEDYDFASRKIGKSIDFTAICKSDKYPELINRSKLIIFSKTSCKTCVEITPQVEEYAAISGVPVVYVYLRQTAKDIADYWQNNGLGQPTYFYSSEDLISDAEQTIDAISLTAVPTILFTGENNIISFVHIGNFSESYLDDLTKYVRIATMGTGVNEIKPLYMYTASK